ncbi:MAG: hypothetical protein OEU92_33370, partial [Alphaproteobacteria bacterium]|nr:hypothetical protein [Alphaproteobacteria bacterium]
EPTVAGAAAWDITAALSAGEPPVIVRDHLIEHGFFDMDPCNLHEGEAGIVAERMVEVLARARAGNVPRRQLAEIRAGRTERLVNWLG